MQSDYTTAVDSPKTIEGFLGVMMGSTFWQPCFTENDVPATVSFIAGQIGSNAKHIEGFSRDRKVEDADSSVFDDPILRR
jgi:hypothetical protein